MVFWKQRTTQEWDLVLIKKILKMYLLNSFCRKVVKLIQRLTKAVGLINIFLYLFHVEIPAEASTETFYPQRTPRVFLQLIAFIQEVPI